MSMTKVIEIDGKQVAFKASAAIPRIYRVRYGRDIFKDLIKLDKELKENSEEDSGLTMCSLEAFENIAYLMVYPGYGGGLAGGIQRLFHLPGAPGDHLPVGREP